MPTPAARPANQVFRPSKTRRLVSAWTINESFDNALRRIDDFQDIFDQAIFMCGGVKGDGSLPQDWPLARRKAQVEQLRNLGVSALNDYGGGARDGAAEIFKSPKMVESVVAQMIRECEVTDTDGVDIDFEHLPAENRFGFTDFIKHLADELHRRGKMLSICVYALSPEARREVGIGFWETSALAQHADHLRAMTYDLYCPPSQIVGPTSTAPWGRDTMAYMATQVPRHKIVMGLPAYSVDWNINDPGQSRQVQDWKWLEEVEKKSPVGRGWCYYWDVNLIRFTDDAGHAHLVYVSDARSTKSHLVTVDSMDLAGICFWALTGGNGDDPKIWEAVREHFRRWG